MRRRVNELKPRYGEPGYEVTRTDEYEWDPLAEGDSLAVVTRQRCRSCLGECRVVTPEWTGWWASVRARIDRSRKVGDDSSEHSLKMRFEREQGEEPEKWEECTACEGRGWNETEVSVRQLACDIGAMLRVRLGKKGKPSQKLEVIPEDRR